MKDQLKKVARELAHEHGLINLKCSDLCKRAGIPPGSFTLRAGCTFTAFMKELAAENLPTIVDTGAKTRANKCVRRAHLLQVAVGLSLELGYKNVTRAKLAEKAGVSAPLIAYYFTTMDALRDEVVNEAIRQFHDKIIAEALHTRHPTALACPAEVKRRALYSSFSDLDD